MDQTIEHVKQVSKVCSLQLNTVIVDFQEALKSAQKQLKKEKNALAEQKKEFEQEKLQFEQMTKKIDEFHVVDDIVTLDIGSNSFKKSLTIGGHKYATSLKRLQSLKGSFFAAMFSGSWTLHPQVDGSYFIDRYSYESATSAY